MKFRVGDTVEVSYLSGGRVTGKLERIDQDPHDSGKTRFWAFYEEGYMSYFSLTPVETNNRMCLVGRKHAPCPMEVQHV